MTVGTIDQASAVNGLFAVIYSVDAVGLAVYILHLFFVSVCNNQLLSAIRHGMITRGYNTYIARQTCPEFEP
jgi:hypothetical protein